MLKMGLISEHVIVKFIGTVNYPLILKKSFSSDSVCRIHIYS